jgi:hypothetical protein
MEENMVRPRLDAAKLWAFGMHYVTTEEFPDTWGRPVSTVLARCYDDHLRWEHKRTDSEYGECLLAEAEVPWELRRICCRNVEDLPCETIVVISERVNLWGKLNVTYDHLTDIMVVTFGVRGFAKLTLRGGEIIGHQAYINGREVWDLVETVRYFELWMGLELWALIEAAGVTADTSPP